MATGVAVFLVAFVFWHAAGAANESSTIVGRGNEYRLEVIRESVSVYPARNLLGVHSLWWGHADGLLEQATETTHTSVSDLLSQAGGVVRYGGGANEISWRSCSGPLANRWPVKAVPWAGPMQCRFGIDEYLSLVRNTRGNTAWLIANLVGENYRVVSDAKVASDAGAGAAMLATQAVGMHRYWELGNELERGRYQWSPEQIGKRASVVGNAILSKDKVARLVLPLIEYDDPRQPPRRIFNERLLSVTTTPIGGVALHLYYDGKPGGPSVSTQLRTVVETGEQAERMLKRPVELWITEHGRWPEGDGRDPEWEKNWSQTNDLDGVLGTADFIIAISQVPSVAGAMLHGLRAGPWNVFDIKNGVPQPTGVGYLLKLLGGSGAEVRLKSLTTSRSDSGYAGGYDLRSAAFLDAAGKNLIVWVVNRANSSAGFSLGLPDTLSLDGDVVGQSLVCLSEAKACRGENFRTLGMQPTQIAVQRESAKVNLPARSVSILRFRVAE
ncbi:MAG: hypothetical protein KKE51_06650 [Gammaproteobacteria bacterium]|nr:hypothetical protein [Gammaproteobacteria bacterium]MBU2435903.1 hypothetical protein [Gammaproteobacteria bacterium]MBU2449316.1 hypothetical protein [Gammaproteobacteria bacterium]